MIEHISHAMGFKQYLAQHKQPITIVTVACICIIMMESPTLKLFPELYQGSLFWYAVIPLFCLVCTNRRSATAFAWQIPAIKLWLKPSLMYLAIALPIIAFSSDYSSINNYYERSTLHWPTYLLTTALYMLGWEYFFRGFLLEGLRNTCKEGAILIQVIPFTLLHLGKPTIETLSCILSGIVWGYICYHTRSFWPAFFMHMVVNIFTVALINT